MNIDFCFNQGHNYKGRELIHTAWILACTRADVEKVLINVPEDTLSKKVLAHIEEERFGLHQ
jgi:hypothetical protein